MKKLMLVVALMIMGCGNPVEVEPPIYEINLQVTEIGGPDSLYITWNPIPYVTSDFEGYYIEQSGGDEERWEVVIMDPDSCSMVGTGTEGDWRITVSMDWNGDFYYQHVDSSM